MKKKFLNSIIAITAIVIGSASCTCSNKKAENTQKQQDNPQEALIDTLEAEVKKFVDLASKLNPAPFVEKDSKGVLSLTEKEKMVKPDYLINPTDVRTLTSLSQKYRAVAVLGVDRIIADLYEMPVVDFDDAIFALIAEIHDGAISQFMEKRHFNSDDLNRLISGEYAIGRGKFAWEFLAASIVEQLFVLSVNFEKLLPMFDDSNVESFSYNLSIIHEAFDALCQTEEDMIPLRDAILPLYAINAKNVGELHDQLIEMKGAIEISRHYLFK